jgi:hypothetical protein
MRGDGDILVPVRFIYGLAALGTIYWIWKRFLLLREGLIFILVEKAKEAQKAALDSKRQALDVAVAARIGVERPEVDMREDLDGLISILSDDIARIEEHLV